MLKIFRKNQFLRSILLLPVALVLNINLLFITDAGLPLFHSVLDPLLYDFRLNMPVWHWLGFGLMLFAGAVLINRMVIINRLSNTITLFPGLFYLLIGSALPVFGAITSITISLVVFILFISNMMYFNARTGASNKVFNVGLYLGLLSLLFMPQLLFLFLVFIGINFLTTMKQRVVFNLLNGVLLPFYMTGLVLLFIGYSFSDLTLAYLRQFGFDNFSLPSSIPSWISLLFIVFYLIIALLTYNGVISKKSIQSIRKINVFTWSIPFVLLVYFISGIQSIHLLILLSPVLAFYTSEGVLRFKKESNGELILILLVVFCIVMPFLQ